MTRIEAQVWAELALRCVVEGQLPKDKDGKFRQALEILDTPTLEQILGTIIELEKRGGKLP